MALKMFVVVWWVLTLCILVGGYKSFGSTSETSRHNVRLEGDVFL
jgi:hypothetical protein